MKSSGRILPWKIKPIDAIRRWPRDVPLLMLHSGRPHARWSRFSILARPDGAYRYMPSEGEHLGRSQWLGSDDRPAPIRADHWRNHPLHDLKALLEDRRPMWIGYLGYDLGRYIEKLPTLAADDRGWPIVQMHRCPGWLVHDNLTGDWRACGTWASQAPAGMPDLLALAEQPYDFHADQPIARVSRDEYEDKLRQALAYIAAGDIFQVNLTQRFTATCQGHPRELYHRLAEVSPAWYGAYLELLTDRNSRVPEPERAIVCTSPELFFEVNPFQDVITRPIKGTRPACVDPDELWFSPKDTAELTMIVDLLRNDLGRVCSYGTIRVPEPRVLESHPTVHHTVATVTGRLHPSKHLIDLIRAVMPGGSITGAPKVRAMQIIEELEPVRRGPYTGAIGYIHGNSACFNIAIRTMLVEKDSLGHGRVDYNVGGGIVADSVPDQEYQETLDKAAAMLTALRPEPVKH